MSGMFRALGSWLSFKMKKKQMKLQTGNVLRLKKCAVFYSCFIATCFQTAQN